MEKTEKNRRKATAGNRHEKPGNHACQPSIGSLSIVRYSAVAPDPVPCETARERERRKGKRKQAGVVIAW
jgi:hypothetical protein